ncbi:MAG: hypothetical protein K6F27_06440 [Ruminococcus sp.]|nr:hypothetical protein [Ruminococcus sp.]
MMPAYTLKKRSFVFLRGCGFVYTARCGEDDARETLEKMRGDINDEPVVFDKKRIAVTITVGMSRKQDGHSIDEWIQHIDDLLYAGKTAAKTSSCRKRINKMQRVPRTENSFCCTYFGTVTSP